MLSLALPRIALVGMIGGRLLGGPAPPMAPGDSTAPFVTGAPAAVVLHSRILTSLEDATECVELTVRAVAPIPSLSIVTSGLGDAMLAPEAAVEQLACDKSWGRGAVLVAASNITLAGERYRLMIRGTAFPHPGTAAQGAVLLVVPGRAPIAVPITLQTDGPSDVTRAVFWFFGILVPAALTALVGYVALRGQRRLEAALASNKDFRDYKRVQEGRLATTFTTYLPALSSETDAEFCAKLREELQTVGALDKLPDGPRSRIVRALDAGDRRRSLERIMKAFPEWSGAITRATSKN